MAAFRPTGLKGGVNGEMLMPGDLMLGGESLAAGALATVGSGTIAGALIAGGIIYRTGPVAGFTDTTDTAANILVALTGNNYGAEVVPGTTFRLTYVNTVAQNMTYAGGTGVISGLGTLNVAASTVREYLATVMAVGPVITIAATTVNGSANILFILPTGSVAYPQVGYNALNLSVGMSVTGAGIPGNTTVLGITQGQGGIIGVTLSANATATALTPGTAITFTPTIKLDGIRSSTL